jgi:hypothetical protein
MIWLSRLTFLIGDPVQAAAVTICGFLLFSGLGSLTTQWIRRGRARVLHGAVVVILVLGLVETAMLPLAAPLAGTLPGPLRCVLALAAIAPLFAMGFPMPLGLQRLAGSTLVPWAWGTNGFSSVLAAPLAMALAMTWGYSATTGGAMVVYAVAGLLFLRLPGSESIST